MFKNTKQTAILFILAQAFLFVLFSCSNIDEQSALESPKTLILNQDVRVISGAFEFPKGAVPQEIINALNKKQESAKSESPKTAASVISMALKSTVGQFVPTQESLPAIVVAATNGNLSFSSMDADSIISVNEKKRTFEISGLSNGAWTITIEAYDPSDKKRSAPLFLGKATFELSPSSQSFQLPCVSLSAPNYGGEGTCALAFSCSDENASQAKVEWTLKDAAVDEAATSSGAQIFADPKSAVFNFGGKKVPAGVYEAAFYFYKEFSGEKYLIFQCVQNINVFDGLETNVWQLDESAPFITKDGLFVATKECLAEAAKTIFYVSPNGDDNADDSANGFRPFATIQKAIDQAVKNNDGKSERIIFVSGTILGQPGKKQALACIDSETPIKLLIQNNPDSAADAVLDANGNGRVMYVGKNASVSLKGVVLRGGNIEGDSGAGVYVDGGKLSLLAGAEITENTATLNGGGVCFVSEASNAGAFSMAKDSLVSKNAALCGAGVYIKCAAGSEAAVSFLGGTIGGQDADDANAAADFGGGLYISTSDKSKNTVCLDGTAITFNKAGHNGGGVYKAGSGELAFASSEISSNTCGGEGGGVFVYAGSLVLKGSQKGTIKANSSKGLGGGIRMEIGSELRDSNFALIKNGKSAALDCAFGNTAGEECLQDIFHPAAAMARISEPSADPATNAKSIQKSALPSVTLYLGKTSAPTKNVWPVTSVKIKDKASIDSASEKKAELKGDGSGSVFAISGSGDVVLKSLAISGGFAASGGGVCDASLGTTSIICSEIYGNTASSRGGGIYKSGGSLVIDKDSVVGKKSSAAADKDNYSNAVISEVQDETCGGGGIYASCPNGKVEIKGLVSFNYSSANGGGVYLCKGNFESGQDCVLNNFAQMSNSDVFVEIEQKQ